MQEVAQLSQFDEELYKVCKNVHTRGNLAYENQLVTVVRGAKQSVALNRLHTR